MPTYEYHCESCGHSFDALQKITSSPLTRCPECGEESLRRGLGGGVGLAFHGSGFYKTDYGPSDAVAEEQEHHCCCKSDPAKTTPCCKDKKAKQAE